MKIFGVTLWGRKLEIEIKRKEFLQGKFDRLTDDYDLLNKNLISVERESGQLAGSVIELKTELRQMTEMYNEENARACAESECANKWYKKYHALSSDMSQAHQAITKTLKGIQWDDAPE